MRLTSGLLTCVGAACCVVAAPTVTIGPTTLHGVSQGAPNVEIFGNIPFATPPVGTLRFQPPQLQTALPPGDFNATSFGPACIQVPTTLGPSITHTSEDCLTVNVFRPAGVTANASLPVMAWIYGGGFVMGTGSIYNASALVAQSVTRGTPVVYVSFNYRLGPLGFASGDEAAARGILNLGLKDQFAALQWVQTNIGAFGGDRSKVTVFGESAGAFSLGVHFLNPNFTQVARAGIYESGQYVSNIVPTPQSLQSTWESFVDLVPGCNGTALSGQSIACLQNASTSALSAAFDGVPSSLAWSVQPWQPVLDGPAGLLPDYPARLLAKGQFAKLPSIAGTNKDEGTLVTPEATNSTADIRAGVLSYIRLSPTGSAAQDAAASKILELYPDIAALGSPFGTGNETFGLDPQYKRGAAINCDLDFTASRRLWSQTVSKAGVKTFAYLFTDPQTQYAPYLGVPHSSEVDYVYKAPVFGPAVNGTSSVALSINMADYWLSFATSLDPNDGKGSNRTHWPQYTSENPALIQLDGTNTTVIPDTFRQEQIGYIADFLSSG